MQAAEVREPDNLRAALGAVDSSMNRRVLSERKVVAARVVVDLVGTKQPARMPFTQHNDVVEEVAPDGADDALTR